MYFCTISSGSFVVKLCGGSSLEAAPMTAGSPAVRPPNRFYVRLGIHQKSLCIRAPHGLLLIWNEALQPFVQLIPLERREYESNWTINLPMAGFHHGVADGAVSHWVNTDWLRLHSTGIRHPKYESILLMHVTEVFTQELNKLIESARLNLAVLRG